MKRLQALLNQIHGKAFPAYKQIKGTFHFSGFDLKIEHVQGDPFAAPSKLSLFIPRSDLAFCELDIENGARRVGIEDAMLRAVAGVLKGYSKPRGSGKSGFWGVLELGQEMTLQSGLGLTKDGVLLRITVGLPGRGRTIDGRTANQMLINELPLVITRSLLTAERTQWTKHADANEDQETIRKVLKDNQWVAFIANGSQLARKSGISDLPIDIQGIEWQSPASMEVEVQTPHRGSIKGTALAKGITLICGGGYHGKSTLLKALARCVYNHIPGDGREYCIADADAVSIRAEDGRSIQNVNISWFISNLPQGISTEIFSSVDASGSTSQAANIMEAVELGAQTLLIDEDTSATNFMIRDKSMQQLIAKEKEPITPFIDRVQALHQRLGISTLLVVGGVGDYFAVADRVLVMDHFRPYDETKRAHTIGGQAAHRQPIDQSGVNFPMASRCPLKFDFLDATSDKRLRVRSTFPHSLQLGRAEIDCSFLSQLLHPGQLALIGDILSYLDQENPWVTMPIPRLVDKIIKQVFTGEQQETVMKKEGTRVGIRHYELGFAINRYRKLRVEIGT